MAIIDIRGSDALSQLPGRLLQAQIARAENEARQERLKIEQGEFKLQQEQHEAQQAERKAFFAGTAAAANILAAQRPDLKPTLDNLTPAGQANFMQSILGFEQTQEQTAGIAANTAGQRHSNRFAADTHDLRVRGAELENRAREATIALTTDNLQHQQVMRALAVESQQQDPQKVANAQRLWTTGDLTLDEAFRLSGVTVPESLDGSMMFTDPFGGESGGAAGEQARKAMLFGTVMHTTSGLIDNLVEKTGGLSVLASLQRQTSSPLLDIGINAIIDEDQRRLVNAHRQFGDAYRFFLSGQQSSDREALRMLNTVAEQAGDGPETIRQKRLLRQAMTAAAFDVARGASSPEMAAQRVLTKAGELEFDTDVIQMFEEQLNEARQFEAEGGMAGLRNRASSDPTQPDAYSEAAARMEARFDELFQIGPEG